jgi:acyl dehydratase/NAD(P)-dependent dehydrogenase (short-subunit alcohol dehydrogenase family)
MTSHPQAETTGTALARRAFTADDQREFAHVSGDFNPLHLDADFARRTQMGAPVVHGIHHLLWALDSVLHAITFDIRNIKVRFQQPLYLDETAELKITARTETSLSLDVATAEAIIATIKLSSQPGKIAEPAARAVPAVPRSLSAPADLPFEQMANCAGAVSAPAADDEVRTRFPHLTAALGISAVRALLATSQIVGMACPGLHSLFAALDISRDAGSDDDGGALRYAVSKADARFRLLQIDVSGCGMTGRLEAFARLAPPKQPDIRDISARVSAGAFEGQRALIVGGSRGLGEVTAKIIAAGGGHVLITYRDGKREAERVRDEIRQAGGSCEVMRYDALAPASDQLGSAGAIDSCYYFATGRIFQRKATAFVPERLRAHLAYYVDGFHDLCAALTGAASGKIGIFYPSTVAIDEKTGGIAEYAMAKAAGETLANHLNAWFSNTHVVSRRLPRILTDQTATVGVATAHDALDVLLPIVYEVQRIARP